MERGDTLTTPGFSATGGGAEKCEHPLRAGDHPEDPVLNKIIKLLYQMADYSDDSLGRDIGVERTTMNRYRRGVWIPGEDLKIKICKRLTEKTGKYIAIQMIWGSMPLEVDDGN